MKNNICKQLIMIGPFPPPIHGMSNVNLKMKDIFELEDRINIIKIDTAIIKTNKNIIYHILRIIKIFKCLILYIKSLKRNSITYLSVGGGLGTIYDIIFVLIQKLYHNKLIIHHHSSIYVANYKLLHGFLFFLAGNGALHVCLCNGMANRLVNNYNNVKETVVLSNSVFIIQNKTKKIRRVIKNIGFFSNITEDKGIFDYLETIRIINENKNINGIIAGPILENSISDKFYNIINKNKNIQYIGPVYNDRKRNYFESIDLLVSPSINEAEPVSVLESLSFSVPVIAIDVGCLNEIISDESLLFRSNNFSKNVAKAIISMIDDKNRYERMQLRAAEDFSRNRIKAIKNLKLINNFINGND